MVPGLTVPIPPSSPIRAIPTVKCSYIKLLLLHCYTLHDYCTRYRDSNNYHTKWLFFWGVFISRH